MTNLSFILFNFNLPMPLIFIEIVSLTAALFFTLKTRNKNFSDLILFNYRKIAAAKSRIKITDSHLTFCFYSLLFAKLCVRIYIVYTSSR